MTKRQWLIHTAQGARRWVILAAVFLFAGGMIALWWHAREERAASIAVLQAELAGYVVPAVEVGRTSYTIEGGVVRREGGGPVAGPSEELAALRAGYASVASRIDPVFGLEGTDPDQLAEATDELDQSVDAIAAAYDPKAALLIREDLYPLAFLHTLPKLETERNALIAHPRLTDAKAYEADVLSAIRTYRGALARERTAFSTITGTSSPDTVLEFPTGTTAFSTFETSFATLDDDARHDADTARARLACLTEAGACPPLSASAVERADAQEASAAPAALSASELHIEELVRSAETERAANAGETFRELGVVRLAASACAPSSAPANLYLWEVTDRSGETRLRAASLGAIYFYDLTQKTDPFYATVRQDGLPYLYQNISNLYECPDSGADLMHAATAYALSRLAAAHPLLSATSSDPLIRQGARDERSLAKGPVVLEESADQYAADLATLINTRGEYPLARSLSEATVLELERRVTLARTHTAFYAEELRDAVALNALVPAINALAKGGSPDVGLEPLMLTRSYPSLFFFAADASIAASSPSFLSGRTAAPLDHFGLTTYESLRQAYPDSTIAGWMGDSVKTLARLGIRT